MIGNISENGDPLKPYLITSRKTIEIKLYQCGYDERKLKIVHQPNAFCTADIFKNYIEEILIPTIEEERRRLMLDAPAFILIDGFSEHLTEEI